MSEPDVDNSHIDKGETYKLEISHVTAHDYCDSVCAFAVKPRAFGAPQAALGALTAPRSRAKGPAMGCNVIP
jgi:hypothetical protein